MNLWHLHHDQSFYALRSPRKNYVELIKNHLIKSCGQKGFNRYKLTHKGILLLKPVRKSGRKALFYILILITFIALFGFGVQSLSGSSMTFKASNVNIRILSGVLGASVLLCLILIFYCALRLNRLVDKYFKQYDKQASKIKNK